MLTARRATPKACQSCRRHLLSIFKNGFTSTTPHASRARYTTALRPRPQTLGACHNPTIRRFTASTQLSKDVEPQLPDTSVHDPPPLDIELEEELEELGELGELPQGQLLAEEYFEDEQTAFTETVAKEPSPAEALESIVRQARQTFGETLPKDYLSAEEYILYERLYGPPLRETQADDLEYIAGGEEEVEDSKVRNVLLQENAAGEFEEVELDPGIEFSYTVTEDLAEGGLRFEVADGLQPGDEVDGGKSFDGSTDFSASIPPEEETNVNIQGKNQREIDAIKELQKGMAAAKAQPIEEPEEEEEEWEEEEEIEEEEEEEEYNDNDPYLDSNTVRTHPHTMTARSGTHPSTIFLPQQQFIAPITELLERTNMKHVAEAAQNAFGGPGLPFSSSVPASKKHLPQNHIPLDAAQHRMTDMEADAYMSAVMPGTYAMSVSTLVEVRKRLGTNWLRNLLLRKGVGPRVMDAGAAGTGVLAWREMAQAEWDVMREEDLVKEPEAPAGKTTVLTGADTLRHRISRLLDNTTFLPRLPDYVHSAESEKHLDGATPQPRKHYDIIIAPHALFHFKEEYRRKNVVQNLWSLLEPKGGVLILIEKGLPRGFEAIAGARSLLLEKHIASPGDTMTENEIESPASDATRFSEKEEGMIIAPCTTHTKCPMYLTPGLSSGRKDFCHFGQRFIRPPFLQKVLGASRRNHEDAKFSYLAVRRGIDLRKHKKSILQGNAATDQAFEGYEEHDLPASEMAAAGLEPSDVKFHSLSLPRAVLPPLKGRGHVTLDLCTPSGQLERWTVPRSFSKTAYRDARKSRWGDLWALGAKTRVVRQPRLGRPAEVDGRGGKMKGIRDGKIGKGGKKVKKNKFDIIMGPEGFRGIKEDRETSKFVKREKRTKGGRVWKQPKPITEEDLG
ncbi:hypothetical protein HYALB_00009120 [Hymenoscyphus albidus]|uniref:Uncharacterized protein n=1 Tax=Hymenoscyphus albidus TaxID=595503 RepID=A0A9N9LKE7_9HELO|nr:hypothetical protein HYALB_00009120 [Hymenoscyphus albidus]